MAAAEIDAREAHASLATYRVIDVREPHEFHGPLGRIAGAELLPLGGVAEQAEALADGQRLLLVCRSGKRSGVACERLAERGCHDVTNLAGGMIGWNRAGLPTEQSPPTSLGALVEAVFAWVDHAAPNHADALREGARRSLGIDPAPGNAPEARAVEALIDLVEDALADAAPPDLDLSVAAFRRSLAAL